MIDRILSPEVQSFIKEHYQDDLNDLRLKYKTIFDMPANVVVDQISGRKKAKEKLPSWYAHKDIIYPPSLNLEQSSSERTAEYKMRIVKDLDGIAKGHSRLLDLTGGFGIDSFFLGKTCKELHFVEPNADLLQIASHNHHVLGSTDCKYYNATAEEFLNSSSHPRTFNLVYIDPSRRSRGGQKVFSLSQCDPDIIHLQNRIYQVTNRMLVKTSPLLDIKQGLKELLYVTKVYVVSVVNECKELLFLCDNETKGEPIIEAINLDDKEYSFSFSFSGEAMGEVAYSDPMVYLYEPNASILKSGAFKTIAGRFNIYKLHPNTHLYTSDYLIDDFPGKVFKVESFVKSNPKELAYHFEGFMANIITRNYPLSVSELRKKTRLKEGGNKFLIGCSGVTKKFLVVTSRIR
ncbi:MAG TPA: hypothetical protein VE467_12910 [Chryseolinea sp.]|nr:hypothetical protein [Chryseolinea sp.]